jgi:hypothetical protein
MDIRIVCEGPTDSAVLRVVMGVVLKDYIPVINMIHPDEAMLRKKPTERPPGTLGPGWQGVRAWLKQGAAVQAAMAGADLLVVHVDADIRRENEIARGLRAPEPSEDELDPLCEHVKSWFAGGVPPNAIVVLPREATEAWLLAVHSRLINVEAESKPAKTLQATDLIGPKGGEPHKRPARYRELAASLAVLIADNRQLARVPELERFVNKLRSRARVLRRAKKAGPSI